MVASSFCHGRKSAFNVSTNIVNLNDSFIKTTYDDVNEKLTDQLDNINKTMKDIL